MGLVPFLVPFVWVLDSSSCGGSVPAQSELTGTMVIGKFELEGWLVIVPVLLVMVLTPFLANRLRGPGLRVWVQLLGLATALMSGWGAGFAMYFTIFSEREAQGVGWLVLACFAGAILDGLWRVVWATIEWRRPPVSPAPLGGAG